MQEKDYAKVLKTFEKIQWRGDILFDFLEASARYHEKNNTRPQQHPMSTPRKGPVPNPTTIHITLIFDFFYASHEKAGVIPNS